MMIFSIMFFNVTDIFRKPNPRVRYPADQSQPNTLCPILASPTPKLMLVVVFPTPPFWLDTAITLHITLSS